MSDKNWVYVEGPYTHPDPVENTHNAIKAGVLLREAGYCPVIPHLSLLAHIVCPRPPRFWYDWDLDLMGRCDYAIRLPGDSWGADREDEHAKKLGISVHNLTAEEFLRTFGSY